MMPYAELTHRCSSQGMQTSDPPHAVLPGLSPVESGPSRLPPMGLIFDAVAGELPLVQRVWSASCDAATSFTSAAKGSSMIAFARTCDRLTVHLRGPET